MIKNTLKAFKKWEKWDSKEKPNCSWVDSLNLFLQKMMEQNEKKGNIGNSSQQQPQMMQPPQSGDVPQQGPIMAEINGQKTIFRKKIHTQDNRLQYIEKYTFVR